MKGRWLEPIWPRKEGEVRGICEIMSSMRALEFTSIILRLCAINSRAALLMFYASAMRVLRWASCEAHGILMSEAKMKLKENPKPRWKMMKPVKKEEVDE